MTGTLNEMVTNRGVLYNSVLHNGAVDNTFSVQSSV